MTKPIFEPNTQREVAAAQYATQQLFRRPAPNPGAQNQIPWIRMRQLNLSQSWGTNDEQVIIWDDICYSNDPPGTDYFVVSDYSTPGDNAVINPLVGGLFQTTAFVIYDDGDDGFMMLLDDMYWDQHEVWIAGTAIPPAVNGLPRNDTGTGFIELTWRNPGSNNFFEGSISGWNVQIHTLSSGLTLYGNNPATTSSYWEIRYLGPTDDEDGLNTETPCGT